MRSRASPRLLDPQSTGQAGRLETNTCDSELGMHQVQKTVQNPKEALSLRPAHCVTLVTLAP